jgi:hypothetical protein
MDETVQAALRIAQGPLFRFAIALALLGLGRIALLGVSDVIAAFLIDSDGATFRRKLRLHALWLVFPSIVAHEIHGFRSGARYAYHLALDAVSLLFHVLVVILPIFLVAHVYLWERALGIAWPALPGPMADVLSIVTLASGVVVFLGRVYSPVLRRIEPVWSFFKPVLLLIPFLTGTLTRHPTWSPLDYHAVLLIHVLSAAIVLALLPFARLLSSVHTGLAAVAPETGWRRGRKSGAGLAPCGAGGD